MSPNDRKRLLLLASGLVLAIFVGDRFILSPMLSAWKERSEKIGELKTSIDSGEKLIDRAETLERRWDEINETALPAGDAAAAESALLNAVNDQGKSAGLNMTALKPHWVEDDDLGSRLEIRVSAEGSLGQISRFIYNMKNCGTPVRIEDIELRARDDHGATISVEARLSGLIAVDGEERS